MKKTVLLLITLCISMMHFSCKTKAVQHPSPCVQVIQHSPATPLLPESELMVIKSLFKSNRMDDSNYQFHRLDTDELGFKHVRCYQFVDNLKVFTEELIFHFNQQDSHYRLSGHIISSTGLDAIPSQKPNKVVDVFIQRIKQEKTLIGDSTLLMGCFEIELGAVGSEGSTEKFEKVWKVNPAGKTFPYAYIKDKNAEISYYDNGIRSSI